jgi:hypothetical protein
MIGPWVHALPFVGAMKMKRFVLVQAIMCGLVPSIVGSCSRPPKVVSELAHFDLNSREGVLDESNVAVDSTVSNDGIASLKITASGPTTVRLFELGDVDVENAKVVYRAMLRSRKLSGKAYLEMWVHLKDGGEYFSRGLDRTISGTTNWMTMEIMFILEKGQNPDNVKLNLVIEGKGTVWIDDIVILKGPPIT